MAAADLPLVFDRLRDVLTPHTAGLTVTRDEPGDYYVDSLQTRADGYVFAFGAVKLGKRYVSYHLPPVYAWPDLLDEIPADLRKRMQGKSCFNFTRADDELFAALDDLTARARTRLDTADAFAG